MPANHSLSFSMSTGQYIQSTQNVLTNTIEYIFEYLNMIHVIDQFVVLKFFHLFDIPGNFSVLTMFRQGRRHCLDPIQSPDVALCIHLDVCMYMTYIRTVHTIKIFKTPKGNSNIFKK